MTKKFIAIVFFLFSLLLIPAATMAETYYVAPNGDNDFSGTKSNPWKTISHAITQISPGDEVLVRGGVYPEQVKIQKSGVTIRNYPNERPVIDGQNRLASKDKYDKLVFLNADKIVFDGFEVKNSLARGITIREANYCVVKNSLVHHTKGTGICIDTNANYTVVENTEVHHHNMNHVGGTNRPWGGGIQFISNKYSTVRGCIVHEGYGEGILFARGVDNGTVEFSTTYDNWAVQIYVDLSRHTTVKHNLIYGSNNKVFHRYPGATGNGIVVNCEIVNSNYGYDVNIYGNLIAGSGGGIHLWNGNQVTKNVKVFNNTVVEPYRTDGTQKSLNIGSNYRDHQVINNIFIQTEGSLANVPNAGEYKNNLWNKSPEYNAQGPGDVIGNALLSNKIFLSNRNFENISINDFALQTESPAIDAGIKLDDKFKNLLDCKKSNFNNGVYILANQNIAGKGWEIGADVCEANSATLPQEITLIIRH